MPLRSAVFAPLTDFIVLSNASSAGVIGGGSFLPMSASSAVMTDESDAPPDGPCNFATTSAGRSSV